MKTAKQENLPKVLRSKLSLGLGGVWLGVAPEQKRMNKVREILELPDNVEPFSVFVLGYPEEQRHQQNRYEEERIHFVE